MIERPTLHLTFQVRGDVINATESTFFNIASTSWNNARKAQSTISTCNSLAYGEVSGQNQQIPPRDWQFSGRFRFQFEDTTPETVSRAAWPFCFGAFTGDTPAKVSIGLRKLRENCRYRLGMQPGAINC